MKHLKKLIIFCSFYAMSMASVCPMYNKRVIEDETKNVDTEQEGRVTESEKELVLEIVNRSAPALLDLGSRANSFLGRIVSGNMKNAGKGFSDLRRLVEFLKATAGVIEGTYNFSKEFICALNEHMREVNSMEVREEFFQQ